MRLKSLFSRFQSTLPREERLNASTTLQHCDIISIHAPTRGATTMKRFQKMKILFQSTLPREERRCCCSGCSFCCYFNPRSHERSDVIFVSQEVNNSYFNPRSHERSDGLLLCEHHHSTISIHAPTRGATAILHKKFVYFYTIPTINI